MSIKKLNISPKTEPTAGPASHLQKGPLCQHQADIHDTPLSPRLPTGLLSVRPCKTTGGQQDQEDPQPPRPGGRHGRGLSQEETP